MRGDTSIFSDDRNHGSAALVFFLFLLQQNMSLSAAFTTSHRHQQKLYSTPSLLSIHPKRRQGAHGLQRPTTFFLATNLEDEQIPTTNTTTTATMTSHAAASTKTKRRAPVDHTKNCDETYGFWEDTLSVASFNMDLENLAQADPLKAADALEIMEAMYRKEPDNDFYVKPNAASYTTVIDGWVRFQALPPSTLVSTPQGDTVQHPYNSQNNGHHYGAQQAQKWLDRLESTYETTGDPDLRPNTVSYMLVCQKWADDYAQDFTGESISKAQDILIKIRKRQTETASSEDVDDQDFSSSRNDDVKMWSIVLDGWCRRAGKVRGAIHRAEALLTDMENEALKQEQQQTNTSSPKEKSSLGARFGINIVTYTNLIGGLARSRERNSAQKAEAVLERMKRFGIEPDMVAYSAVLGCYAKASSRKERGLASKRALEILDHLETQYSQEKYYLKPNLITYATAIKAIGNSLDRDSAALAEKVLRRMYSLHEAGTIANVKPQTSTYNAVISAYASHSRRTFGGRNFHSGQNQQPRYSLRVKNQQSIGLKNARRAEQLLVEMTKRARAGETDVLPNVRTWGVVISAWAESGQPNAGSETQRVLDGMLELYARGESYVLPNVVCYTTTMAAKGNSALQDSSIQAVAKNSAAADQVEEQLISMENDYESSMDVDKRPNAITYLTAIDCFNKLDEVNGAARSQRTVDRMMRLYAKGLGHVRPSRIVFNALINAWSKSPAKEKGSQAEEVFQWMEKQYRDAGDYIVKPDEVSLCGVLNARANNGEPLRAQQILDQVESMTTKERGFQHSTISHNIVIKAWGRSKEKDAVQRAEQILVRLEKAWEDNRNDMLKPDVTTYSSVINCCAYHSGGDDASVQDGRSEAFQVAIRTFRKLCASTSAKPNNVTFGTLMKAIANLTPMNEEREDLIRTFFAQCCKEGQVDAFVLSQVRNASPNSLYRELVLAPCGLNNADYTEGIDVILKKLPPRWRH